VQPDSHRSVRPRTAFRLIHWRVGAPHAARKELDGVHNVAGDGVLALSEVASLLGKPLLPVLPPVGTGLALAPLRRLGLRIPDEMLQQLRYGRGVDNRRLKATGYQLRYTTREAVTRLAEHFRTAHLRQGADQPYRYEREVEEFLRYSPSVRRSAPREERRRASG